MAIEGERYSGRFRKIALNRVCRPTASENILPEILHRWFGPGAGAPGSVSHVTLRQAAGGWELVPDPVRVATAGSKAGL